MALSAFGAFLYIKLQVKQFSGLADRGCGEKKPNYFVSFSFFFLRGQMSQCFEVKIKIWQANIVNLLFAVLQKSIKI